MSMTHCFVHDVFFDEDTEAECSRCISEEDAVSMHTALASWHSKQAAKSTNPAVRDLHLNFYAESATAADVLKRRTNV